MAKPTKAEKKAAAAKKADDETSRAARDRDFEQRVGILSKLIRRPR